MTVSVGIVAWCFSGLRRLHGSSVLLALFALLTLVGGGVGHIPFFVIVWLYSRRMRKPLRGVARVVSRSMQRGLARSWLGLVFGASLLFLLGLEVSVFGLGTFVTDPDRLLRIDWRILLASLLGINAAYLTAMVRDAGLPVDRKTDLHGVPSSFSQGG